MNIKKKFLPILLMLAMLAPATWVNVFANGETAVPDPVQELVAYPSFKSVVLTWKAESGVNYLVNGTRVSSKYIKNGVAEYRVAGLEPTPGKKYTFNVQAYYTDPSKASAAVTRRQAPVRRINYLVKVKRGGTLRAHNGRGTYKLKAGKTLRTDRFATGRYIFDYNGKTFYVSRSRLGSKRADYAKKVNYSRKVAEYFVNNRKLTSKKNRLIWVSTYTQHVYLFKKSEGKWVCYDDWECATGTASTPSPTSASGLKVIGKKIRSKNSLPYWSAFHGEASFHGKKSGWKVGKPASNGCIRNGNSDARTIYKYIQKGTRVFIY